MRKNVINKYSLVKTLNPSILNMLYCDLTGNTSTFNDISKDMQERLKLMLELEDPNIIVDLRTNNGFKGSKFDIFWSELQAYFNENTPAVDDRCHETILHLPWFISVRNLQETIISHLKLQ